MRVRQVGIGVLALAAAVLAATQGQARAVAPRTVPAGAVRHVVWIWMENHSYNTIIGSPYAPYINSLAARYGSATNAWAISHPSAPNYVGATSGLPLSSLPPKDCTTCQQPGPDLFTQGETWRAYQESMTTPCQQHASLDGLYVLRHNPPHYFLDISTADCLANNVPYTALASDLAKHNLPAFSFITPNLVHDMHNGATAASKIHTGDTWLANNLPSLLNSPEYKASSMVIFLMWDEGGAGGTLKGVDCTTSTDNSCHVPLVVISPYGTPGAAPATKVNHYSVLKATEELLGLPKLGQAGTAPDLRAGYGLNAQAS
jgi:phosphatidylinositol-3-phosphatase